MTSRMETFERVGTSRRPRKYAGTSGFQDVRAAGRKAGAASRRAAKAARAWLKEPVNIPPASARTIAAQRLLARRLIPIVGLLDAGYHLADALDGLLRQQGYEGGSVSPTAAFETPMFSAPIRGSVPDPSIWQDKGTGSQIGQGGYNGTISPSVDAYPRISYLGSAQIANLENWSGSTSIFFGYDTGAETFPGYADWLVQGQFLYVGGGTATFPVGVQRASLPWTFPDVWE